MHCMFQTKKGNVESVIKISETTPSELRAIMLEAVMHAFSLEKECKDVTVVESNDQTTQSRIDFSKNRFKTMVSSTRSLERYIF